MNICQDTFCTGCSACFSICPKKAIEMKENNLGEIHPSIDTEKCIQCNLCIDVCPTNKPLDFKDPLFCYASWSTNTKKRAKSASGGIATALAEYIIQNENGIFYGTRYRESDMEPIISSASTLEELEYFKGSKYVQSNTDDSFIKIKNDLKNGKSVLFIGTPCQVAGLKSYLRNSSDRLLFTCDLICHGVCPSSYFKDEIEYLKQKKHIKKVTNCTFRGNDGNNFKFVLYDRDKVVFKKRFDFEYYFDAFLKAVTLRKCCYNCQYANSRRISDITIGDFIGLGIDIPFDYNAYNASVLIINNNKGLDLWNNTSNNNSDLSSVKRSYSEAVKYGPSLNHPFKPHKHTKMFNEFYPIYGYSKSIRKVYKLNIFMNKLNRTIYILTHFYKIPIKAISLINKAKTNEA